MSKVAMGISGSCARTEESKRGVPGKDDYKQMKMGINDGQRQKRIIKAI